jgi:hypothetical protein
MGLSAPEQEARRLDAQAREHMRKSRQHRRRARELREQLDRVIAAAAAQGIHITINRQAHEGEPSGHHNPQTAGDQ